MDAWAKRRAARRAMEARLAAEEQAAAEAAQAERDALIREIASQVPPGEMGLPGLAGVAGAPGRHGRDGVNGRDGQDGQPGRDGVDGRNGADGAPGRDGRDGTDGRDGRDLRSKYVSSTLMEYENNDSVAGRIVAVIDQFSDGSFRRRVVVRNDQGRPVGLETE